MSGLNYQKAKQQQRHQQAAREERRQEGYKRMDAALERINANAEPIYRRWLNVPYSDKDEAKRAGCRWDPQMRRWWCKLATPEHLIQRWL